MSVALVTPLEAAQVAPPTEASVTSREGRAPKWDGFFPEPDPVEQIFVNPLGD